MTKSKVYFCKGVRDDPGIEEKTRALAERIWFPSSDSVKRLLIKLHVGECTRRGLDVTTHIEPEIIKALVELARARGAREVILTDSTPIYTGQRSTPEGHRKAAADHGFTMAPFLVGDKEGDVAIQVKGFGKLEVPAFNHRVAEGGGAMLVAAHFKSHPEMLIGGALKQLGMGCVGKAEKKRIHHAEVAVIDAKKCEACAACVDACGQGAMRMEKTAVVGEECVGCGLCAAVCPAGAIRMVDRKGGGERRFTTVEYLMMAARAVADTFGPRLRYFTDLTKITPHCDCFEMEQRHEDLCPDVGFLASDDPVSIDSACLDLIASRAGEDAFVREMHRYFGHWHTSRKDMASIVQHQMEYAERIGLGRRDYELVEL